MGVVVCNWFSSILASFLMFWLCTFVVPESSLIRFPALFALGVHAFGLGFIRPIKSNNGKLDVCPSGRPAVLVDL